MDAHVRNTHANESREDYLNRTTRSSRLKSNRLHETSVSSAKLAQFSHQIEKVKNEKRGRERLRCKLCHRSYAYQSLIIRHLEDHKNGIVKDSHVCKNCGSKYKTNFLLRQHQKLHTACKQKTTVPIKVARKARKGIKRVKRSEVVSSEDIHENIEKMTLVGGKVMFRCRICPNREFLMVRAVKRHLEDHESGIFCEKTNRYKCAECGTYFRLRKEWASHQNTLHEKTKNRYCS